MTREEELYIEMIDNMMETNQYGNVRKFDMNKFFEEVIENEDNFLQDKFDDAKRNRTKALERELE